VTIESIELSRVLGRDILVVLLGSRRKERHKTTPPHASHSTDLHFIFYCIPTIESPSPCPEVLVINESSLWRKDGMKRSRKRSVTVTPLPITDSTHQCEKRVLTAFFVPPILALIKSSNLYGNLFNSSSFWHRIEKQDRTVRRDHDHSMARIAARS
jgi:hypothetical protein